MCGANWKRKWYLTWMYFPGNNACLNSASPVMLNFKSGKYVGRKSKLSSASWNSQHSSVWHQNTKTSSHPSSLSFQEWLLKTSSIIVPPQFFILGQNNREWHSYQACNMKHQQFWCNSQKRCRPWHRRETPLLVHPQYKWMDDDYP